MIVTAAASGRVSAGSIALNPLQTFIIRDCPSSWRRSTGCPSPSGHVPASRGGTGSAVGGLLAEGRGAVVYDLGPGRLLRRHRNPAADAAVVAAVLRLAAHSGVPVPEV